MKVDFSETEFIRTWEGFSLSSYRCSAGVLTCGWGCTGPDILADTVWTEEYAKERFMKEIDNFCTKLDRLLPPDIHKNKYLACLSLSYNIGIAAFATSTLLRFIKEKNYGSAAEQFLAWTKITVKGKKIFSKGLHTRRKAERDLFLTP
jgi:lysozyme